MKNTSASLLHTAWTPEEKVILDDAIEFIENYQGINFILDASRYLYNLLKVDYILITVVDPLPQPTVKSVVLLHKGVLSPNIHYPLAGSPCEGVFGKEQNYYPAGVLDFFPKNELLTQLQVKSYLGIPVFDKAENGLGCLVLLHHNIIDSGGFVEALINVMLPRLEEELTNFNSTRDSRNNYGNILATTLV